MKAFDLDPSDESTSAERARQIGIWYRRIDHRNYVVGFHDSDERHAVSLLRDSAGYVGNCSCRGYQFHEPPCAHLLAIARQDRYHQLDAGEVTDLLNPMECPHCGEYVAEGIYGR